LSEYDHLLRTFQYNKAVDLAVQKGNIKVLVSLFEELIYRKSLSIPLSNRTEITILPILEIIRSNITRPDYSKTLLKVMNCFLDLNTTKIGQSKAVDDKVKRILLKVQQEITRQKELQKILGIVDMLLGASRIANE